MELPGALPPKLGAKGSSPETALVFAFTSFASYALLLCLHLSLVLVCAAFSREMPDSEESEGIW